MKSVQQASTVTFSTNSRNQKYYPDTNRFKIDFPTPIRNVTNISLQSMEMNLSQMIVQKGKNDRLRISEGIQVGGVDPDSTTIRLTDSDNPNTDLYLPSYLNPVTGITATSITCHRPIGFKINENIPDSTKLYLINLNGIFLINDFANVKVDSDEKNVLNFDQNTEINTENPHPQFVYCAPLSIQQVIEILNSQLPSKRFAVSDSNPNKLVILPKSPGSGSDDSVTMKISSPHASGSQTLKALGFSNNQSVTGHLKKLVAHTEISYFDCFVEPGNYDMAGFAKAICAALNPGALQLFSTAGYESISTGHALFAWEDEYGQLNQFTIPQETVFWSPNHLIKVFNARSNNLMLLQYDSISEKFTITRYSGNPLFSLICGIRQLMQIDTIMQPIQPEATMRLQQMLGLEPRIYALSAEVHGNPVRWPKTQRTWEPMYLPGFNSANNDYENFGGVTGYDPYFQYLTHRYVVFTTRDRPFNFSISTIPNKQYFSKDQTPANIFPTSFGEIFTSNANSNTYILQRNDFAFTHIKISNQEDINKYTLFAPNPIFSIFFTGVTNSINYRLGVSRDYAFALMHPIEQQFDLKPNHYFLVALNNVAYIRPSNTLIINTHENDNALVPTNYERQILARCVISAPFVFDRGQAHSVALSQPTRIASLEIELLDESGTRLFETNQQEISFTFGFAQIIKA